MESGVKHRSGNHIAPGTGKSIKIGDFHNINLKITVVLH